ncbi:MAG: hypothetical protein FWB74_06875 [Defluviitaleaceae bacterium]|nr:hypothetical protein [Defluviitaleaceae bacterium]
MSKDKEIATVGTIFMYRMNVAVACILLFMNMQILIHGLISDEVTTTQTAFVSGLLVLALVYGAWAFNGMGKRFVVYANALEYRSLFKRFYLLDGDVERVTMQRKDERRLKIEMWAKGGKRMVINTMAYKEPQPLIDYLAKFK